MRATTSAGWSPGEALLAAGGPALLLVAAVVPALRPVAALAVLPAWAALRAADRPAAIAWAAVLPLVVVLAWPWVVGADVPVGDPACRDPLSGIALRRLLVAAAGAGLVAGLAVSHRSTAAELGLCRPSRAEAVLAAAGALLVAVAGLVVGPWVAQPFFGNLAFPVPPGALVPAVVFGLANGMLEELLYRGALQAWLGRIVPMAVAIAFQGVVFGLVHVGPEVVDLVPLHAALLAAVGVAAGIVRRRTGSLWIVAGIHVGADVALYVGLACRPAP
jgi:membrane protease YdiL (CAAX protease family)